MPNNLSSIPGTHAKVQGDNTTKLSSDPHVHSVGCLLLPQNEHMEEKKVKSNIEKRPNKKPKYYTSRKKTKNFHNLQVMEPRRHET